MIDSVSYYRALREAGISYFAGVPDSLLRSICECISDRSKEATHLTAANEGGALAYAAGRYLATGDLGMVYLQNSGCGNLINPLTSLVDPDVYSIPTLLLIGWRGQPGQQDEPQHLKQGRVQEALFDALEIRYSVHPDTLEDSTVLLAEAVDYMVEKSAPYALLVPKGTFGRYRSPQRRETGLEMRREEALRLILDAIGDCGTVVATTGKTSREVFELRASEGKGHGQDFLTVGSMGHTSHIALGVAHARPRRQVYCIDGDGAFLMHMGSTAVNASLRLPNFKHIVINNGAHESVGGQPTVALDMDLPAVSIASGYRDARSVASREELVSALDWLKESEGPLMLEVKVALGSRDDLGRPTLSPTENKAGFMARLSDGQFDL